jgi:hypothetical protein
MQNMGKQTEKLKIKFELYKDLLHCISGFNFLNNIISNAQTVKIKCN